MPDIFFPDRRPHRISPFASAVWRKRSRLLLVVHARRAGWTKSKNLVFMERCAAWKQNSVMITTIPLPFCCQAEPWTQQRLVIKSFVTGGSKYARFILVLSFILEGSCGGGRSRVHVTLNRRRLRWMSAVWSGSCCAVGARRSRASSSSSVFVLTRWDSLGGAINCWCYRDCLDFARGNPIWRGTPVRCRSCTCRPVEALADWRAAGSQGGKIKNSPHSKRESVGLHIQQLKCASDRRLPIMGA